MTPGEKVKLIRKEKNMTLEQFGKKVGVTKQTISRIENGINALTEQMILSICREFNVNEDWLRTGEGEMFIELDKENQLMIWAANALKDESDSFKKRFVKMLMELDESDWETLEKFCMILYKESHDVTPGSETSPKT